MEFQFESIGPTLRIVVLVFMIVFVLGRAGIGCSNCGTTGKNGFAIFCNVLPVSQAISIEISASQADNSFPLPWTRQAGPKQNS